MTTSATPSLDELLAICRRYHPAGHLDAEPGYEELPQVQSRRAIQASAPFGHEWAELLHAVRELWPDAKLLDHSTLHLDSGRQLRVMRDSTDPGHHLVVWVSILAPVALVYESHQAPRRPPKLTPPELAADGEGVAELRRLVEAQGFSVLPWDLAQQPVKDTAVGNLLPGEATVASCLFSDALT